MATAWGQLFCIMSCRLHPFMKAWDSVSQASTVPGTPSTQRLGFSSQECSTMLMWRPTSHTISPVSHHFRTIDSIDFNSLSFSRALSRSPDGMPTSRCYLRTILQVSKRRGARRLWTCCHAVTIRASDCSRWKDPGRSCWRITI